MTPAKDQDRYVAHMFHPRISFLISCSWHAFHHVRFYAARLSRSNCVDKRLSIIYELSLLKRAIISINTIIGKFIRRENEFRLLYLTDVESDRYGMPPLSPYPPVEVVKLNETALEVRLPRSRSRERIHAVFPLSMGVYSY